MLFHAVMFDVVHCTCAVVMKIKTETCTVYTLKTLQTNLKEFEEEKKKYLLLSMG